VTSELDRVRAVRERLFAEGAVVAGGARRDLFPVAIGREEGLALRDRVAVEGAARTLEVGLGFAISTLFLCEGLLANGPGGRHVAIDPYQLESYAGAGLRILEQAGVLDLVELRPEESQIVLPRLLDEGRRFDLAFVDGNHRFEAVFLDLIYAARLLEERAIVFVDDTQLPGCPPRALLLPREPRRDSRGRGRGRRRARVDRREDGPVRGLRTAVRELRRVLTRRPSPPRQSRRTRLSGTCPLVRPADMPRTAMAATDMSRGLSQDMSRNGMAVLDKKGEITGAGRLARARRRTRPRARRTARSASPAAAPALKNPDPRRMAEAEPRAADDGTVVDDRELPAAAIRAERALPLDPRAAGRLAERRRHPFDQRHVRIARGLREHRRVVRRPRRRSSDPSTSRGSGASAGVTPGACRRPPAPPARPAPAAARRSARHAAQPARTRSG
jgi:predicted O-methyltransferase YrrM